MGGLQLSAVVTTGKARHIVVEFVAGLQRYRVQGLGLRG